MDGGTVKLALSILAAESGADRILSRRRAAALTRARDERDRVDDGRPARVVGLDPSANRTYHYWHVFLPNAQPGQLHGYRVEFDPWGGMRFDPSKVFLNPYGRGVVVPGTYSRAAARHPSDNTRTGQASGAPSPTPANVPVIPLTMPDSKRSPRRELVPDMVFTESFQFPPDVA
jgi:pullulanase/glycogen debranching enzyme